MAIYGWLTPSGSFIECDIYEHMAAISKNEVFTKKIPKLNKIHLEIKKEDDYYNSRERDSWHMWEMFHDEKEIEFRNLVLDYGFMRVGEVDGALHFEGRPNWIERNYQLCKDFADGYAADVVFEPIKKK